MNILDQTDTKLSEQMKKIFIYIFFVFSLF